MDPDTDDEVLRRLADGHHIDYAQWPSLLSRLIPRLEHIVYNDFPIPPPPPHSPSSLPPSSPPQIQSQGAPSLVASTSSPNTSSSSQSTNKENASPITAVDIPPGTLSPQVLALLTSVTQNLRTWFSKHPPHTVQRFAELILAPKQHYRALPSYLHAIDRVVHVTSGAHIFPLPPAITDASSAAVLSNGTSTPDLASISWGNPTAALQSTLGSDESLGGALLTPIPWLRNGNGNNNHTGELEGEVKTESTETIEGPNGAGSIETVSVSVNGVSSATVATTSPATSNENTTTRLRAEGGVTQGELLRQEQRAGVVPAAQLASNRGDSDGMGEEDEAPHARGPEEIGMEDMGPQAAGSVSERGGPGMGMQGIDVEAAVGRRVEVPDESAGVDVELGTPKREAEEELGPQGKKLKLEEGAKDEEMEFVDADGKSEAEKKVGDGGENIEADAVDANTV